MCKSIGRKLDVTSGDELVSLYDKQLPLQIISGVTSSEIAVRHRFGFRLFVNYSDAYTCIYRAASWEGR